MTYRHVGEPALAFPTLQAELSSPRTLSHCRKECVSTAQQDAGVRVAWGVFRSGSFPSTCKWEMIDREAQEQLYTPGHPTFQDFCMNRWRVVCVARFDDLTARSNHNVHEINVVFHFAPSFWLCMWVACTCTTIRIHAGTATISEGFTHCIFDSGIVSSPLVLILYLFEPQHIVTRESMLWMVGIDVLCKNQMNDVSNRNTY